MFLAASLIWGHAYPAWMWAAIVLILVDPCAPHLILVWIVLAVSKDAQD